MARKTNYTDCRKNSRYRLQRKVGMRQNKDGEWVPHIKSFYGRSKSEAEKKYIDYMSKDHPEQSRKTFQCLGEAIDYYIEAEFMYSNLAESTKLKYLGAYRNIFLKTPLPGQPLNNVTAMDLQNVYNDLSQSYATRRALHNFLGGFYKYADRNSICQNITRSLNIPKGGRKLKQDEIEVWEDDEVKTVIDALENDPLRLLIVLAVSTGARFAELLALQYEDISDGMLSINKQLSELPPAGGNGKAYLHLEPVKSRSSNRAIPLSDEVMQEIEKHRALQRRLMRKYRYDCKGYLFTTSNGTLYFKRNIVRALNRLYRRIHIPYRKFHAYRHTFGTNLSRAGVPLEVTSKLMGHASIEITARYYINVEAERRREAIEKITQFTFSEAAGEQDENDKKDADSEKVAT